MSMKYNTKCIKYVRNSHLGHVFSTYYPGFFSIFTLKRPLFLTDGVYIALAAAVPIGHRFKIHLFWTTKINDGPFISGSDFFHANYFFGKKHIYFLATDLDRGGILWPHHTTYI